MKESLVYILNIMPRINGIFLPFLLLNTSVKMRGGKKEKQNDCLQKDLILIKRDGRLLNGLIC